MELVNYWRTQNICALYKMAVRVAQFRLNTFVQLPLEVLSQYIFIVWVITWIWTYKFSWNAFKSWEHQRLSRACVDTSVIHPYFGALVFNSMTRPAGKMEGVTLASVPEITGSRQTAANICLFIVHLPTFSIDSPCRHVMGENYLAFVFLRCVRGIIPRCVNSIK